MILCLNYFRRETLPVACVRTRLAVFRHKSRSASRPLTTGSTPSPPSPSINGSVLVTSHRLDPLHFAITGSILTDDTITDSIPSDDAITGSIPTSNAITGLILTGDAITGSIPTGDAITGSIPTDDAITGSIPSRYITEAFLGLGRMS